MSPTPIQLGGAFTPRTQPWSNTPNLYHVVGLQPGQVLTSEFRQVYRAMHTDKLARMLNNGLDEVGLLAQIFKKPIYRPTVNLPPDMYNAIWNSASSGNVPWVGGLEHFIKGKHLPVLRGK
eukprot:7596000-Pyramimonas_sp.AAC.1